MENKAINIAVVGLGMASKPHLAALKQLAGVVDVTCVYTRNSERRSDVAQQWGWAEANSIEEICEDQDIDGAILITPPNARVEIVQSLAASGKHILMEKPVERSLDAAQHIVDTCEDANVQLGIVFQHRFRAGAQAMAELVQSGKLGKLQLARVNVPWWRDQSYYDQPGRGSLEMDGGGVLLTQAIHVLDLMLSLTGPAKDVVALTGTTDLHTMETEDFASVGVTFENGAMGSIMATTASYPGFAETLELDFEHAALRLIAGELTINWRDGRSETVGEVTGTGGGSDPMDFPCDWHKDLIANFAHSISAQKPFSVTGREALKVHALIDAIERSAASGQKVLVGDN